MRRVLLGRQKELIMTHIGRFSFENAFGFLRSYLTIYQVRTMLTEAPPAFEAFTEEMCHAKSTAVGI